MLNAPTLSGILVFLQCPEALLISEKYFHMIDLVCVMLGLMFLPVPTPRQDSKDSQLRLPKTCIFTCSKKRTGADLVRLAYADAVHFAE